MENKHIELSEDSDLSVTYYKNISTLESEASSNLSKDSIKCKPMIKINNYPDSKNIFQYKLKQTNALDAKSSIKNEPSPRDYQRFSDEIIKLKQIILNLNCQFERKANENSYKEGKVKDLEKICIKNKRKMKEMKTVVKKHEEKIIQIESRLGVIENFSFRQVERKNYASQIILEKKILNNIGCRSQKTFGSHLAYSPKIKSNISSLHVNSSRIKKAGK